MRSPFGFRHLGVACLAILTLAVLPWHAFAQAQGGGSGTAGGQAAPPTTAPPTTAPPTTAPPTTAPPTTSPTTVNVPVTPPDPAKARPSEALVPPLVVQYEGFGALPIFGEAYFADARLAVTERRKLLNAPPADPTQNAVGPDALTKTNVSMPVPARYQLGPGDTLLVRYSSPTMAGTGSEVVIDRQGGVLLPSFRAPIILRGLTVEQAQQRLTREMRNYVKDAVVDVQLKELRSMTIRVLGEAFAPGTYEVPSVITLYNALYAAGGPNSLGSFRNIRLQRAGGGSRNVDLYQLLLKGDGSLDLSLEPGDVILIPPAEVRVGLRGEVRRPAVYELRAGEKLKDLLAMAGGVRPSGVSQRVALQSVRPGLDRKQLDVDLTGSTPAANPVVYDGDLVEVFSIQPVLRNVVRVEGAVDQPRVFQHRPGMRVSDLIQAARGLTLEATTERADLFRQNQDGSQTLIPIRLKQALEKDRTADELLLPSDRLVVYRFSELAYLGNRRITVTGAVQKPGNVYRADGMTVRDVLYQVGGLLPTANDRIGFLQRLNKDGSPGPLVRLDLVRVFANDPAANVALEDNDTLTFYTLAELQYRAPSIVTIKGAVQRPGNVVRAENLTVRDALEQVGGTLPAARVAFLQRKNLDGTLGPLVKIDLAKVAANDQAANLLLQDEDMLTVYTLEQSQYIPPTVVTIQGGVQRPGEYASSQGLTLRDLIDQAGGVMPNASETVEIQRAWQKLDTEPIRVKLMDAMAGLPESNLSLQAGDTITIGQRADLLARPRIITILGQVSQPGPYMLIGPEDRVSDIIRRAGGLMPRAFAAGAEFVRNPTLLTTIRQKKLSPDVENLLRLINQDAYQRASALADMDRLRVVFNQGSSINSSGSLSVPGVPTGGGGGNSTVQPGQSLDQALAKALMGQAVTPARALTDKELVPGGNVSVNLDAALKKPGSVNDMVLQDGDIIIIPEIPTTVSITGAVVAAGSVVYEPDKPLSYYIDRVGGMTNDASEDSILVIRATGTLERYRKGIKILAGDQVLVPTRVMAIRLQARANDLDAITRTISSAAITVALIRGLTK